MHEVLQVLSSIFIKLSIYNVACKYKISKFKYSLFWFIKVILLILWIPISLNTKILQINWIKKVRNDLNTKWLKLFNYIQILDGSLNFKNFCFKEANKMIKYLRIFLKPQIQYIIKNIYFQEYQKSSRIKRYFRCLKSLKITA